MDLWRMDIPLGKLNSEVVTERIEFIALKGPM